MDNITLKPKYETWEERLRKKRKVTLKSDLVKKEKVATTSLKPKFGIEQKKVVEPLSMPVFNIKNRKIEKIPIPRGLEPKDEIRKEVSGALKINVKRYAKTPKEPYSGYTLDLGQDKFDENKINKIIEQKYTESEGSMNPILTPLYDTERKSRLFAFRGHLYPEKIAFDAAKHRRESDVIQPLSKETPYVSQQPLPKPYGGTPEVLAREAGWTEDEIAKRFGEKARKDIPSTHGLPMGKILIPEEKLKYLSPEEKMIEEYVPGSYMALQKAHLNYKNNPGPKTKQGLKNLWTSISVNVADKVKTDPSVAKIMATGLGMGALKVLKNVADVPERTIYAVMKEREREKAGEKYLSRRKSWVKDYLSPEATKLFERKLEPVFRTMYAMGEVMGTKKLKKNPLENLTTFYNVLSPNSPDRKIFDEAWKSEKATEFAKPEGLAASLGDMAMWFVVGPGWLRMVQSGIKGIGKVGIGAVAKAREAELAKRAVRGTLRKELVNVWKSSLKEVTDTTKYLERREYNLAPKLGAKWVGVKGKGPEKIPEYYRHLIPKVPAEQRVLANRLMGELDVVLDNSTVIDRGGKWKQLWKPVKDFFKVERTHFGKGLRSKETRALMELQEKGGIELKNARKITEAKIKSIIPRNLTHAEETKVIKAIRNPKYWILDKAENPIRLNFKALHTDKFTEREIGLIQKIFNFTEAELRSVAAARLARGVKVTPHIKKKGYWPSEREVKAGTDVKPYGSEYWLKKQKGPPATNIKETLRYIGEREAKFKIHESVIPAAKNAEKILIDRLAVTTKKGLIYESSDIRDSLSYLEPLLKPAEITMPGKLGNWGKLKKMFNMSDKKFINGWRQMVLNYNPRFIIVHFLDTAAKNVIAKVPYGETWKPTGWIDILGKHHTYGKGLVGKELASASGLGWKGGFRGMVNYTETSFRNGMSNWYYHNRFLPEAMKKFPKNLEMANDWALGQTEKLMMNFHIPYDRYSKFDAVMKRFFPFWGFSSRVPKSTLTMIDLQPWTLGVVTREFNKQYERTGKMSVPKVRIPLGHGRAVYIDPLTFTFVKKLVSSTPDKLLRELPGQEKTKLAKMERVAFSFGLGIHPLLGIFGSKLKLTDNKDWMSIVPQLSVIQDSIGVNFLETALDRLHIPEEDLKHLRLSRSYKDRIKYLVDRKIRAESILGNKITEEKALKEVKAERRYEGLMSWLLGTRIDYHSPGLEKLRGVQKEAFEKYPAKKQILPEPTPEFVKEIQDYYDLDLPHAKVLAAAYMKPKSETEAKLWQKQMIDEYPEIMPAKTRGESKEIAKVKDEISVLSTELNSLPPHAKDEYLKGHPFLDAYYKSRKEMPARVVAKTKDEFFKKLIKSRDPKEPDRPATYEEYTLNYLETTPSERKEFLRDEFDKQLMKRGEDYLAKIAREEKSTELKERGEKIYNDSEHSFDIIYTGLTKNNTIEIAVIVTIINGFLSIMPFQKDFYLDFASPRCF